MFRPKKTVAVAVAVAGVALVSAGLAQSGAGAQESDMGAKHSLEGTWIVTVDPRPTPAGDQPPFESTLAYLDDHVVSEITSRAPSSAGLGGWRKVGGKTYRTTWHKYRFDATGAYVGRTVVTETIELTGKATYTAHSLTRILTPSGGVVAQFESDATGVRMNR